LISRREIRKEGTKMGYQFATVEFIRDGRIILTRSMNCDESFTDQDVLDKILNKLSAEYVKVKYHSYNIKRVEM